jgi:hypothetical protein
MAIDWLAAYAAGVATIVGGQQIARELPSIRIRVSRNAGIIWQSQTREEALSVTIGNAGRRPVTIEEVAFIAKSEYLSTPSTWVDQTGFTLEDGQSRTLYHRRTALSRRTRSSRRETHSADGGQEDAGSGLRIRRWRMRRRT